MKRWLQICQRSEMIEWVVVGEVKGRLQWLSADGACGGTPYATNH